MTKKTVFPYIPNSVPEIQKEMLDYVALRMLWIYMKKFL